MENQPKKKRADRDPTATRDALLSAGTELFARRGFEGTKVDQLADQAGVNKAMISYHFGGKRGLYNEILGETFAEAHRRFSEIEDSTAPADERLREFVRVFVDMAVHRPALPVMVLREVLSGGLHIDDHLLPQFLALFRLVQGIIDQGIEQGTFKPVNPYLTHISLLGSLVFYFAFTPIRKTIGEGKLTAGMPEVSEYVRHIHETVVAGLLYRAPTPEPV